MIYNSQKQQIVNRGFEQEVIFPNLTSYSNFKEDSTGFTIKEGFDASTKIIKRIFDICFSLTVMMLGLPLLLMLMMVTKLTSKGPIFYKQQRVGINERPFNIYKFRSMQVDAEKMGPQLSKDNDPRITKWGIIMRKTRLDELPQFWNVLRGDMSVVGPRPERDHFIQQIVSKAPGYKMLLSIKPGITSIGQVYYGYAENVDQMCQRMLFDLRYLNEVNIQTDINIILQTVKVMCQGRGK
jgi:lipopolysaccharide/colanic/teichoic acid biosynthesis glycosyltransferase